MINSDALIPRILFLLSLLVLTATPSGFSASSESLFQEFAKDPYNHSHIPYVFYAGYERGETPLPDVPIVTMVTDFGADPSGKTDSAPAFKKALEFAAKNAPGAVGIPNGHYILEDRVQIEHSGVVLRGQSREGVILDFTKPLDEVYGTRRIGANTWWGWSSGLLWIGPADRYNGKEFFMSFWEHELEDFTWSERITNVTGTHEQGSRTITVEDTSRLRPGQMIVLYMTLDEESLAFPKHIAGSENMRKNYNWGKHLKGLGLQRWGLGRLIEIKAINGNTLLLDRPLREDVRPIWNPVIMDPLQIGAVHDSGIENVTVQLHSQNKDVYKHNSSNPGWNAVGITRAWNCWLRNIEIRDAELGIVVQATTNVTVTDWHLKDSPDNPGNRWHHGTIGGRTGTDNLFEHFTIDVYDMHHGISLSDYEAGTVYRKGNMVDGTFDSHRRMPFHLVRTDITMTNTGGPGGANWAGARNGEKVVLWNINITGDSGRFVNHLDHLSGGALVGIRGPKAEGVIFDDMVEGDKNNLEVDAGRTPAIKDLYEAQMDLRRSRDSWLHFTGLFDGAVLFAPEGTASIPLAANVAGPVGGTIEVWIDGSKVGTAPTSATEFLWRNASPGRYTLRARVAGVPGQTIQTLPVEVEVRMRPSQPPEAAVTVTPRAAEVGKSVTFTSTARDEDGEVVLTRWTFPDGTVSEGSEATYTFKKPGTALVKFAALDNDGAGAFQDVYVTVTSGTEDPAPIEVIIDDGDPGTIPVGKPLVTRNGGHNGDSVFHTGHRPGSGTRYIFRPEIPADGFYTVERWIENGRENVPVTVRHAEGLSNITDPQNDGNDSWYPLGAWFFKKGERAEITYYNDAGRFYVDALRLRK